MCRDTSAEKKLNIFCSDVDYWTATDLLRLVETLRLLMFWVLFLVSTRWKRKAARRRGGVGWEFAWPLNHAEV